VCIYGTNCISPARYGIIGSLKITAQETEDVVKEKCTKILQSSKVDSSGFQVGITKVHSIYKMNIDCYMHFISADFLKRKD